jgi:hypothetical protein
MNVDAIEIHIGKPDFAYEPVRRLEAKAEARTAFSNSPTNSAVDAQLRQLAASVGADAVINVEYHRGVSMSSWNSLQGAGLAVRKVKEDITCPVCAETIKRAAKYCRFCGAQITPSEPGQVVANPVGQQSPTTDRPTSPTNAEPLTSTDNSRVAIIALALIGGVLLLVIIATGG